MLYKRILGSAFIISTILVSNVLAFTIRLFSPGFDINIGGRNMFVFEGDTPPLVIFKIAVQNKDNTLTAIESLSAPNITPGDFVKINIPSSVKPGINYWFVAVDSSNESNYATLGPRVIREMFGSDNPTASITADSGTTYKTDAGFVSATKTAANAMPTGQSSFPTEMFPSNIFPSDTFPNGIYPTGILKNMDTDDHGTGISTGDIIGIAVGGFAFVVIVFFTFYCCCVRKAIKRLEPVVDSFTRPNNVKNESSIPIVSTPSTAVDTSNIHKISVLPTVTLAKPQNHETFVTPSSQMPSSTPSTTEYTFSASNENVYNHQYPDVAHTQQSYPPYPYPYNTNTSPQGLPYPSQELMPMPEHFNGGMQPYPPLSPIMQNNNTYSFQMQQEYPNYGNQQNWEMQHSENAAVAIASDAVINQTTKTEHVGIPMSNAVFDQKVGHNHGMSDKAEYNQKPDETTTYNKPTSTSVQQYNKPNSPTVQQYNKPHEREI